MAEASNNGQDANEKSLAAALKAVESSPDSEDAWNHVEDLNEKVQKPDEVAELYRKTLDRKLSRDVLKMVAQRAVNFFEEWLSDDPSALSGLFARIVEIDPEAEWVLERITMVFTVAKMWDELLSLYDKILEKTKDAAKRERLLDEAVHVAKDFANKPALAADYLKKLLELKPGNTQLMASLERLLERQGGWQELIGLWHSQIPTLSADEIRDTRLRIANCYFEKIDDHAKALEELRALVEGSPGHEEGTKLLERVLELDAAEAGVRRAALDILVKNYNAINKPDEAVRVIKVGLGFADGEEALGLRRNAAKMLAGLGRELEAMEHYAVLLIKHPDNAEVRKNLLSLADKSGRFDLYAGRLVETADSCSDEGQQLMLLTEAAGIRKDKLDDAAGAIDLYKRVLDSPAADRSTALTAAHLLNDLLDDAGRDEERLAVLERLADMEQASSIKRFIQSEAARLAERLEDSQRALALWKSRLEADDQDQEALGATIELLRADEKWDDLVEALRKRAGTKVPAAQRRSDLVQVARLQAKELQSSAKAIDTWLSVLEELGEDEETIGALDELMSTAGRWKQLAEILEKSSADRHGRPASALARLADIYSLHLGRPVDAAQVYVKALGADPESTAARKGLQALLDNDDCALKAAEALAKTYAITDDWKATLDLLEPRLNVLTDDGECAKILIQAAGLQEKHGDDKSAALKHLADAFGFVPTDLSVESELNRLAEATGDWPVAAKAIQEAAAQMVKIPARAAQLWFAAGRMLEIRLDDPSGAVDAYKSVLRLEPGNVEALKALAGAGASAGEWRSAAKAFVNLSKQRGAVHDAILEELAGQAEKTSAWDQLTEALAAVIIEKTEDLTAQLLSELEYTIALWHKEHRGDLDAAELAVQRAVKQRESDLTTLRLLAEIQRRSPGPPLVKTLLRIDGLTHRNLDAIYEAAETALQQKEEPDLAREVLQLLNRRGAGLLSYAEKAEGQRAAEDCVTWALDKLIEIYRQEENAKQAAELMIDGARLPLDASRSLELRKRAAQIFEEEDDHGRALELCYEILRETPDDLETLRRAAALCERENRFGEILSLRQRELTLVQEPGKKIELRLEISRLAGQFEGQGVRVDPLLANLEQRPGHEASIDSVVEVYSNRGLYSDLNDILSEQAAKLEKQDDPQRAAALWGRIATLAEKNLHDEEKAIEAYSKVVELARTSEALDGLARLYIERKEPLEAAKWLEQRLEGAEGGERSSTILKLARSLLMAEQHDRAIKWLETLFEEAPRNSEVRRLLFDIYRKREAWQPLAAGLTTAAENLNDKDAIVTYAREAWEIYNDRLETPREAIKVLEKARSFEPDDRSLKQHIAVAYYDAQKLDESRTLVEELIEGFGRRRSSERANLHLLLARILHAEESTDKALDELETAVKMDSNNATILKTMAELARGSGNLERAEFAYRTLLLTVRRRKEDRTDTEEIQPSEVLVELSRIAADRGQKEQATELIESTIEAIMQNDNEAPGLEANLRDHEEYELLRRVRETRLTHITNPRIRGKIQSDLADLLETEFEKPDDALELRLSAIESDAVLPDYHKAARDLASRLSKLDEYVSKVESMLEKTRRPTDVHARCELLLQLGEVMESDYENLEKAAQLYTMAEETGVREVDVWRAAAKVAKSLGKNEDQVRLLGLLTGIGEDQEETRANALYSLAEVQLSHEDTLEEGLKTLTTVMDEDPRFERAGLIIRRASEIHPGNDDILDLYEQIVRKSGDEKMTLHYLEGRVAQPDASLEHARKAVDIALKLEEWERAEKLMLRAVDFGCYMTDGMRTVGWALLGLAERRMEAGDLAGAVKWLGEAGVSDEQDRLFELCARLTELAKGEEGEEGDKALVTKLYESLLEHYPTAREIWEPLADIYVTMKDAAGLDRLTEGVVDSLEDADERNILRLRQARLLLGVEERMDDAVEALRRILLDDPHHEEARPLLLEYLERSGKEEELVEHLKDSLLAAQSRKDIEAITSLSLRLGKMIGRDNPEEAISIYRSSLFWAPEDRGLLESLLEMLGPDHDLGERAELMMRLLSSTEGEKAAELALELAGMYVSADDNAGMMRALELGCRQAPDSTEVLDRMEKAYRDDEDYRGLVSILMEAADRMENVPNRVGLLLKAAALYREQLANPSGALEVLKMASDLVPEDLSIAVQQAACMKDTGEQRQAIDKISSILESKPDDESLARDLLGMRAELLSSVGDAKAAVEDLEELFKQDKAAAPQLEEAIKKVYEEAQESGDKEIARKYMMRLVDFYTSEGKPEEARTQLDRWIDNNFEDIEILYRLRDMDTKGNNWEGVAKYSSLLVELEEEEDQVNSIQRMSHAYIQLDRPGDARSVLEKARKKHPDNTSIRQELLQLYEKEGVKKELARLLMEEAEIADQDKQVELLRRAAVLLKESDNPDEAGPILKKLLEKEPEDLATIRELADLYIDAGRLDDADTLLDEALDGFKGQRSPELGRLYHLKATVSGILGEEETQLNFLNEAFKMDRKNGQISADLADLAEGQENWKIAVTALSNCSNMRSECPISPFEAFLRLARVHVKLEDPQRALFLARRALRENPESEEAADLVRYLSGD